MDWFQWVVGVLATVAYVAVLVDTIQLRRLRRSERNQWRTTGALLVKLAEIQHEMAGRESQLRARVELLERHAQGKLPASISCDKN